MRKNKPTDPICFKFCFKQNVNFNNSRCISIQVFYDCLTQPGQFLFYLFCPNITDFCSYVVASSTQTFHSLIVSTRLGIIYPDFMFCDDSYIKVGCNKEYVYEMFLMLKKFWGLAVLCLRNLDKNCISLHPCTTSV